MFLHLGADTVVPLRKVIAISDMKLSRSNTNSAFLKRMKDNKLVVDIAEGKAKSFVITDEKIYLSAISSLTLKKRAKYLSEIEEDDE